MKQILFVCTHNRCRSIMGQAITNHINDERILAHSAGAKPADAVHPATLTQLSQRDIDIDGLFSKSWHDINDKNLDLVITVCDQAAQESCPIWLGNTPKVHWGLPDPTRLSDDIDRELTFAHVIESLQSRMRYILCHDIDKMSQSQFQSLFNKAAKDN